MNGACLAPIHTTHPPYPTKKAEIFIDPSEKEDLPEVFDDFDLDVTALSEEWRRSVQNSENLRK